MLLLPTASDDLLGSEKWGVGPTVVALGQTPAGFTFGAGARYYLEAPAGGPDWGVRLVFSLLYPKRS